MMLVWCDCGNMGRSPLWRHAKPPLRVGADRRPSMGLAPENQVRAGLAAGGKRIRTLGPRYVDDAFRTILIVQLAFAFLPERPARSQGGTDGSNPLPSTGE